MSCSTGQDVVVQLHSSIPSRITMSRRMNDLAQQLGKAGENVCKALKLEVIVATNRAIIDNQATGTNPRETTSRMIERVYGRNQERNNLVNMLVGDETANKTLSVIAVVGHGGVGKTTLARLVYNDQSVKTHFKLQMWVTVSHSFDVQRLTQEILESACSGCNQGTIKNLDTLQNVLEKNLESKRFLLILDDLWEDEDSNHWKLLLAPLKNNLTKGNVILATTRKPGVAKLDCVINSINLDGLEESEYWSLFKDCTFSNEMHEGYSNLEYIGRDIARKLKGNPLAAKTVGALLRRNLDQRHWMNVLEREEWKHEDSEHGIMPALRISYEYLPFHLQRCFSYCALFPKDYEFRQDELVNIWLAQGLLHVGGKKMEEVGKKYLDDLVCSGIFQKFDSKYLLHDLLHDLAQNVSSEECLSVDNGGIHAILQTTRHLSIITKLLYEPDDTDNGISVSNSFEKELIKVKKHLESATLSTLIFIGHKDPTDRDTLKKIWSTFKDVNGLRVLRLHPIPNTQPLLSNLLNFSHLRYLQLCSNYSSKSLPPEICRLYHLQVLNVFEWLNLEEIPNNFNNLINLRHFIVQKRDLHSLIAGVGKLTHLQELKIFRVRKEREFAIGQLRELNELGGELRIGNLENVKSTEEAKGAILIEKASLNSLYLSWDVGHASDAHVLKGLQPNPNLKNLTITGYGGVTSPKWLTSKYVPTYFEYVHLEKCLAWEILPPLGQLPFLKRLELISMSSISEIGPHLYGCGQYMAFQCLKVLILKDLPKLAKWVWTDQCCNLTALSELSVINCPELDLQLSDCASGAEFNDRFPHLLELWISECPQLLKLSSLPSNEKMSIIYTQNAGSFEQLDLIKSELFILGPNNPWAWSMINFHYLRTITLLEIRSNKYSLPWENLCSLVCLQKLCFKHSAVLFSLPNKMPDDERCLPLMSVKKLSFKSCFITGKDLSWMLLHMPMLSHLWIDQCCGINSIKVVTKMSEPKLIEPVCTLREDHGLLQIPSSLTSLLKVYIRNSPDMVFACRGGLSGLVTVQKVEITNCNKLLSSMVFQQPLSKAYLLPPELQVLELDNAPEGTPLLLKGLTTLTKLGVFDSPELISLDLTSCVALEELVLRDCQGLASVKGPKSLAHLKHLIVESCPGFANAWISVLEPGFSMALEQLTTDTTAVLAIPICKQLTSLQHLTFDNDSTRSAEVADLIEEQEEALQLLTSLKVIEFDSCPNLQHFPAKLHLLPSVEKLIIYNCKNIQSLPVDGLPKSLRSVEVNHCGERVEKMFKEYGKEWKDKRLQG